MSNRDGIRAMFHEIYRGIGKMSEEKTPLARHAIGTNIIEALKLLERAVIDLKHRDVKISRELERLGMGEITTNLMHEQ